MSTATCISIAAPASPSRRPAIRIRTSCAPSPSRPRDFFTFPPTTITSRRSRSARCSRRSRPSAAARRRSFRTPAPRRSRPRSSSRGITPSAFNIIAFLGSFHGRTLGSLSLTASRTVQRRGFGPMAPGVFHAPYREPVPLSGRARRDAASCTRECLAYIENQILTHLVSPDEVAAIVVEPIQGEGGYIVPPPEFLQGLAADREPRTACCSSPTKCSRASAAPGRCSRSSTSAFSPTSSSPRRASPRGCRWA